MTTTDGKSPDSPQGLLLSQIGYDIGMPMRALLRGPADSLSEQASFAVRAPEGDCILEGPLCLWGDVWGSTWWVADFSGLGGPGEYRLSISDCGRTLYTDEIFEIGHCLLQRKTLREVGVEQAERRARLAMNRVGWQDCGASWQEANSHAAYILGLCDALTLAEGAVEAIRVARQIVNGCDYLALLQDHAETLGLGDGAVSHQVPKFAEVALAGDCAKAAAAWAAAAKRLPDDFAVKKNEYRRRSEKALAWLAARGPRRPVAFQASLHGAPPDVPPPVEWMTRDLWMMIRAALDLSEMENDSPACQARAWAQMLLRRQLSADEAEHGYYGHFRSFDSVPWSEKSWVHHIEAGIIGDDAGGHFPHDVTPLLLMLERWPQHPDADDWRRALWNFARGFLIPACSANPFYLLPQGVYPGEGLLSFAGLWHGINAAYGLTAALAAALNRVFPDPVFAQIATGNLQWIAGLNAGLTAESLFASHMFHCAVPKGAALPVSMICGIGRRCAGNWLNVQGAICNGFSTGDQFRFDVPPLRIHDSPSAFTDEDWISHAGAWLSALASCSMHTSSADSATPKKNT